MVEDPHAEAASEIAKTLGKGIDATREAGKFLAPMIRRPLEDAIGICADWLAYARWERQLRLMQRAKDFMHEQGIEAPTRQLPLNFAIPLLQAATMEEDDYLQDAWAKLLVNAIDADSGIEMRRAYISILENMTPLDAAILNKLYNANKEKQGETFLSSYLPDKLVPASYERKPPNPPHDVDVALRNLERLGCVMDVVAFRGENIHFLFAMITALGESFMRACTLRLPENPHG